MAFKVNLLLSAQKDLDKALEYYYRINPSLSKRYFEEFLQIKTILETNPYFEIKYGHIRTLKLNSFPYLVHYIIDESIPQVLILAIVFGKRKKSKFDTRINQI